MAVPSERSRFHPERMPPVPSIIAALGLGLVVPFLVHAENRPTEFTLEFARRRLDAFQGAARVLAPQGEILAERPAFNWNEFPGAAAYAFRLALDDGTERITPFLVPRPPHLLRPPGRLEPGTRYRFSVQAVDGNGAPLGEPSSAEFQLVEPGPELAATLARARRFAAGAELSLVLAGIFADVGSSDDVASALDTYLDAAPAGADAPLARTILGRLGRTR